MLAQIVLRPGEYGGAIPAVHFLYASRGPQPGHTLSEVLFLDRLQELSQHLKNIGRRRFALDVFLTPYHKDSKQGPLSEADTNTRHGNFHHGRRFTHEDLLHALGPEEEGEGRRRGTVVYVCGPPSMTDEVVEFMVSQRGMSKSRVMCEKWW